jgi:hypothetical protein
MNVMINNQAKRIRKKTHKIFIKKPINIRYLYHSDLAKSPVIEGQPAATKRKSKVEGHDTNISTLERMLGGSPVFVKMSLIN